MEYNFTIKLKELQHLLGAPVFNAGVSFERLGQFSCFQLRNTTYVD